MSGSILLHKAVDQNRIDIIKWLITNGVKIDSKKQHQTPLHVASKTGSLEVVKLLIENGAAIDVKDNNKNTPLHYANDIDILKHLIQSGAQIDAQNSDGNTILHLTIKDLTSQLLGFEIVKFLVEEVGANIDH